jgi:hypothetical protein
VAERSHRIACGDVRQDGDEAGDAEDGADLAGHVEYPAAGAEPIRGQRRTAGAEQRRGDQPDAGAANQQSRQQAGQVGRLGLDLAEPQSWPPTLTTQPATATRPGPPSQVASRGATSRANGKTMSGAGAMARPARTAE